MLDALTLDGKQREKAHDAREVCSTTKLTM